MTDGNGDNLFDAMTSPPEARPLPALIDTPEGDTSDAAVVLVNPRTGEVLGLLEADDGELGEYIEAVRDWEHMAKVAKRVVSAELHRRMDSEARWTMHAGPLTIQGESPDRVEWDAAELRPLLRALVAEELISADAAQAALKREVVFTVSKRGVNALRKIGGAVKARIDAIGHEPGKPRAIKLSRS
jgi:hypothetical protein